MADAVVEFLLNKLVEVGTWYADLLGGAENEMMQLRNELGLCKSFLADGENKLKKAETFREIERQIREVVYDAEDTIDECLTQTAREKAKSLEKSKFTRFIRKAKKANISLPLAVQSLRKDKMAPVLDKIQKHGLLQVNPELVARLEDGPSQSFELPQFERDNVVGFEDEEDKITKLILEPKDQLDVISVIGMPGLGKTTLTWKIYESQTIKFNFPVRIWVYVSQVLNKRDVLLTILKEFTNQDMSGCNDQFLDKDVRKRLSNGKFVLFMDDVWSDKVWNIIQGILPMNNKEGKVVITSREKTVGNHANPNRYPYELRFLRDDESWRLLQLKVFGKQNGCLQPLLQVTGEAIAKQCKGLPLAIVVIAGVLIDYYKSTRNLGLVNEKWKEVKTNVAKHIVNTKQFNINEIVEMSYKRLPDKLRDCFLYLGVFPEDYDIPARTLTHLWIAEGFVKPEHDGLERTAQDNLRELIDRNLVMVKTLNPNDQVKTCRVHDVVRSFCINKATEDRQLYKEVEKTKEGVFNPPISDMNKYRRLCIHSYLPEILPKREKAPRVRSLLSFNKAPVELDAKDTPVIPDSFELLRVLDSTSIKFNKFPEGLAKLMHLRYIAVSGDDIEALPKAISDLWNLQTLVINTNSDFLKVEANIWTMRQLRHVITKAAIVLDMDGSGTSGEDGSGTEGENLQTLTRLSPNSCTDNVFKKACNLNKLGVRGKLAALFDGSKSLKKLGRLEKLKLVNDKSQAKGMSVFPEVDFFPSNLKRLTIMGTYLEWKHMSKLAKINTLQVLKLKGNAFSGECWKGVGEGFPNLHYLLIQVADFAVWEATPDYFPNLKTLVLKSCMNLIDIPEGLTGNLEVLDINSVSEIAVKCAEDIKKKKKDIPHFKLILPSYEGK